MTKAKCDGYQFDAWQGSGLSFVAPPDGAFKTGSFDSHYVDAYKDNMCRGDCMTDPNDPQGGIDPDNYQKCDPCWMNFVFTGCALLLMQWGAI